MAMSWLGRLLGRGPSAPPPGPATVPVPDDVAAALTADGTPLTVAVESALREHLSRLEAPAEASPDDPRVPFWLARPSEHEADIEDALRDRMAQRRAAEEDADSASRGPGRRGAGRPAD